jgi:hypothetical protein
MLVYFVFSKVRILLFPLTLVMRFPISLEMPTLEPFVKIVKKTLDRNEWSWTNNILV